MPIGIHEEGTITTYYPASSYMKEVDGLSTTIRKTYSAGSTSIAVRTIVNGTANTLNWLLSDHLGSASITTTADGTWFSELRYSAFGETRYSSGITSTDYRYTGQLQQADINLYYYNARFYDPALGRFVQSDTIVPQPYSIQGYDRYAYVNNNPLRYTDPSGHYNEQGAGAGLSSYKQLAKAFEKVVAKTSYSSYNGHLKEYLSTVSAYYYAQASGNKAAAANNYTQVMDQKNRLIVNGYSNTSNAQSTAFNMAGMEVSGMAGGIIGIATSAMSTRSVSTEFNIYARTENLEYTTIYPAAPISKQNSVIRSISESVTDTIIETGYSKPPENSKPNSIYEQLNVNGSVQSRTFYNENGQVFCRQDFDHRHFIKSIQEYVQPHEHNYTYNQAGYGNGISDGPVPFGYTNQPTN